VGLFTLSLDVAKRLCQKSVRFSCKGVLLVDMRFAHQSVRAVRPIWSACLIACFRAIICSGVASCGKGGGIAGSDGLAAALAAPPPNVSMFSTAWL